MKMHHLLGKDQAEFSSLGMDVKKVTLHGVALQSYVT